MEKSNITEEDFENMEALISWGLIQQSAIPALEPLIISAQKFYINEKRKEKEESKLPIGKDGQPILKLL